MMRKTFGIYAEDLSNCVLFIETGDEYMACWCKHNETNTIKAFELFTFKQTDIKEFETLLKDIKTHSRLLNAQFEKLYCIWGNEKCICIPTEFYKDEAASSYMRFMFGDNVETNFYKNTVNGHVVVAVLPAIASTTFDDHHVHANVHKYYQLLKGQQTGNAENKIHLVFYYSWFIISVYKHGNLQLIQRFFYKASEDALYHVLNIFKTYELSNAETNVYASGMIDTSSPLYETLRGYVHNFFIEPVNNDLFDAKAFDEYPLHYFASCQYGI